MNKILATLTKLGLSETEASLYLHLIEHGEQTISDISRGLTIHRPILYKAIAHLKEQGIISLSIKGKQKFYIAERPERLREMVKDLSIDLEEMLPDLEDLYISPGDKPKIKYLEGKKGVTAVFLDVVTSLKKGEMFYRYTSEQDVDRVNKLLPKDYRKIRDEKKLERLVISNPTSGSKKKPRLERFIKFIPQEEDLFQQNAIQLIYSDKIALIDLNSESSIIIENKTLAEFQKTIFRLLYKRIK